jgi:two-component sensor histidine kinase
VDKREVDKREHERESLSKQRQALFRESNHRIKNNLAVIDSLINLSSSHLEDPIALGIFNDIRVRIQSMARAHGLLDLCDDREKVDIKGFLEGLVDQNISSVAMIGRNIQVHKHFPEAGHSVNTAMAVGFILSEMLCNCAKHAFTDRSEGAVNVLVRKIGRDRYELVVKDDGGGFPKDFKDKKDSIGMELMETMAEYVEGTLVFTNDKGATAILRYRDTP